MVWGARSFSGLVPRTRPRMLPEGAAQVCENCWLDEGRPRPIPVAPRVPGVGQFLATVKSIWRFDATRWFQWDEDVDVVRAPVREDTTNRIMWTGDGAPKQTSVEIMGSSFVSPGTPVSRPLGVPAPDEAPTILLGVVVPTPVGLDVSAAGNIAVADTVGSYHTTFQWDTNDAFTSPTTRYHGAGTTHFLNGAIPSSERSGRIYVRARFNTEASGLGVAGPWTAPLHVNFDNLPTPAPTGLAVSAAGDISANRTAGAWFVTFQWDTDADFTTDPASIAYDQASGQTHGVTGAIAEDDRTGKVYVRAQFTTATDGGGDEGPWSDVLTHDFDGGDTAGIAEPAESHAWVYTYVTNLSEESAPSPPSAVVLRRFDANGAIQSATIRTDTGITGAWNINRKRIYRTATGASGVTIWQLVAEIPLFIGEYVDARLTSELGEELLSEGWAEPPDNLAGLTALPNGVLAGFVGRDVYFSEPYQPHAWPPDYVITCEDDVVGLGAFGTNVVVGTKGRPYIISVSHPDGAAPARMELVQPCAAKRSFAHLESQGIAFASHEGLVQVGPGGGRVVTEEFYAHRHWQALSPEDFRAVYHDGAYVAFSTAKTVALDPANKGAVEIDDAGALAVLQDTERDTVYFVDSSRVLREWKTDAGASDTLRTMRWRSRLNVGRPRRYFAAQVIANSYPVTFHLWGDGEAMFGSSGRTVNNGEPFRIPGAKRCSNWEFEVAGSNPVEEVRIGAMREMF